MPHAIAEYSENLSEQVRAQQVVSAVHTIMLESGLFAPDAVKSRAHVTRDYHVGTQAEAGKFLHVWIYLLEGRTEAQKLALTHTMFARLSSIFSEGVSLSVDIRDLDKRYYQKN